MPSPPTGPTRPARDFPKALEILHKHAGTKYDPMVVDALDSAYAKGAFHISKCGGHRGTSSAGRAS